MKRNLTLFLVEEMEVPEPSKMPERNLYAAILLRAMLDSISKETQGIRRGARDWIFEPRSTREETDFELTCDYAFPDSPQAAAKIREWVLTYDAYPRKRNYRLPRLRRDKRKIAA